MAAGPEQTKFGNVFSGFTSFNPYANNGNYGVVQAGQGLISGFDFSIPSVATITEFNVVADHYGEATDTDPVGILQISKDGGDAIISAGEPFLLPESPTEMVIYTGLFGFAWEPAEVNSEYLTLIFTIPDAGEVAWYVDYITLQCVYTIPAAGECIQISSGKIQLTSGKITL